jgi:hypothetical protein
MFEDLLPIEQTEDTNSPSNLHSPRVQEALKKILKDEQDLKKRTFNHYEEIRKRDKAEFLSTKVQKQMERDAQALGKAFYD